MPCWTFSRHGCSALVETENATILQFIRSRVSPYLQVKEFQGDHDMWMIQARRTLSAPHAALKLPERLSYQEASVSIDPCKRVIIVSEASERLVGQRVIRLLRNLFRLWLAKDAVFVHGGMIEVAGRGIAFLGEKYAGKTSSLLAILSQVQASFIENDSLSFHFWKSQPSGLGWFRSTYIRRDVLTALAPVVGKDQAAFQHLEQAQEKSSLAPQRLATTFGCTLLPQTEVHLLIFPRFLPREAPPTFSLEKMTKEEARIALNSHLVPVPNEYHQFLRPHFSSVTENTFLLEKLIEHVPCYRLLQSFAAITAAAQAVITLADSNICYPPSPGDDVC